MTRKSPEPVAALRGMTDAVSKAVEQIASEFRRAARSIRPAIRGPIARHPREVSTVGELMDYLEQHPREVGVVLARDSVEDRGYSPLSTAELGMYFPEDQYCGDVLDACEYADGAAWSVVLGSRS